AEQAQLIGQLVGFDFSDVPVVQEALHDPESFQARALRHLGEYFIAATRQNPVFLEVEDIHWADERSLDLLNNLVRENTKLPFFMICMARPSLYDRRPSWGEGQDFHARIALDPLSRLDTRRLIREILKKVSEIPTDLRDLIADRAEGNPFYVEELIKALIDDGVIVKGKEEWTVAGERLANVRVPSTLTGVLQARLDGLPAAHRALLQRASVVGRVFWDTAAVALSAVDGVSARETEAILDELREREMILLREETGFGNTNEYVFRHAILRDVTFGSLPPRQRRAYHGEVARWLITASGQRVGEYATLIADHFEKAGEAGEAVRFLEQAGDRALEVSALAEGMGLYERALEIVPAKDTAARSALLAHIAEVAYQRGDLDRCIASSEEASELAEDPAVRSQALELLGRTLYARGDIERSRQVLNAAVDAARESGDARVLASALSGSVRGDQSPELRDAQLAEALALAEKSDDLGLQVECLSTQSHLQTVAEDFQAGRETLQRALELARKSGNRRLLGRMLNNTANLEQLAGSPAAALEPLREALAIMHDIGDRQGAMVTNCTLGEANIAVGDYNAASRYLADSLEEGIAQRHYIRPFILGVIGRMDVEMGEVEKGMRLLGAARLWENLDEEAISVFNAYVADWRERFGDERVDTLLAEGAKLDAEQLIREEFERLKSA
ncbi:MAG: hypothetical protein LJE84_06770, partial [Gammaproteobacteria bacterium]|nr:hypothetical protein [Gammaproteobacteria bacterium]